MSININIIFFIKISNNSLSFLPAHSMDDLQGRWAKLSLNTKETQMVNLSTNVVENSRVLVAKFFTKWRISLEAITRTLKMMWRSGRSFDIRNLGNNIVMLLFNDEDDPKRILMQGPRSFDKYMVGLFHPAEAATVEDTMFDTTSFWVQNCGL